MDETNEESRRDGSDSGVALGSEHARRQRVPFGPFCQGVLWSALGVLQFLACLSNLELTGPHEARVAATAREMAESGDYLIPHLNGKPRLQKPPLAYWATALSWAFGAHANVGLARIPAALCGLLATLFVMDLGRRILGRGGGILCGLLWVSNLWVVSEFRKCMADPYLAFFSLLAIWAWVASQGQTVKHGRLAGTGLALLFWLALGFGALAKGPLVFLHVTIALVPYHLAIGRGPRWSLAHCAGVVLFLGLSLPWPILVLRQDPGALELWLSESLGQAISSPQGRPWWYYLAQLPLLASPWILLAVPPSKARLPSRSWLWPFGWLLLGLFIFSCSSIKKSAHLLPLAPALTILLAFLALGAVRRTLPGGSNIARIQLKALALLGALAMLAVLAAGLVLEFRRGLTPSLSAIVLAVPSLALVILGVRQALSSRLQPAKVLGAAVLLFAVAIQWKLSWLDPIRKNAESPAAFARAVIARVGDQPIQALHSVSEELIFYLGRRVPVRPIHSVQEDSLVIARERDLLPAEAEIVVVDPSPAREEGGRLCLLRITRRKR